MPNEEKKLELAPVPIFRCKDAECKAWVREELAESSEPACPICSKPMIRGMKHLPKLVKKFKKPKAPTI